MHAGHALTRQLMTSIMLSGTPMAAIDPPCNQACMLCTAWPACLRLVELAEQGAVGSLAGVLGSMGQHVGHGAQRLLRHGVGISQVLLRLLGYGPAPPEPPQAASESRLYD